MDTPLGRALGKPKRGKDIEAELRQAFGIETVGDLLRHYPRRYLEWNEVIDLDRMAVGEEVTLLAEVTDISHQAISGSRAISTVKVRDGRGQSFSLRFFGAWLHNRPKSPALGLKVGNIAAFTAVVGEFGGKNRLERPQYEVLGDVSDAESVIGKMMPIYPLTGNVRTWELAKPIRTLLETVPVNDPMPATLRAERKLLDLGTALRWIHRPESYEQVGAARKRLKWDEAFAVQLSLVQRKLRAEATPGTPRPVRAGGLLSTFDSSLPYELTAGQVAVGERIAADLSRPHPMHRLLQGEVGSGKTVVALRAMLQVVDAGAQAALLAPTEVLAGQHHRSIRELLGPLGRAGELDSVPEATQVTLITGSQSAGARREALAAVAAGRAGS